MSSIDINEHQSDPLISRADHFYPDKTDTSQCNRSVTSSSSSFYTIESRAPHYYNYGSTSTTDNIQDELCVPPRELRQVRMAVFRAIVGTCCFLFVLVGIALGVFFGHYAKERKVDFQFGGYSFDKNKVSFGRWGLAAPFTVDVFATNENYFDITLTDIVVTATHPIYNGQLVNGFRDVMILEKRSDNVPYMFPLTLRYEFANDPSNAYMNQLKINCTSSPTVGVYLEATITSKYKVVTREGVRSEVMPFIMPCDKFTRYM